MSFFLAFLAGILTIAAPCILPMLPVVLGSSIGQADRFRPACIAAGFVVAFSTVAFLFSLVADVMGLSQQVLRDLAIGMLMIFGILMIWPEAFRRLSVHLSGIANMANALGTRGSSGRLGGFLLGISLGAVWTPCAGPVLGSILTLIATDRDHARAAILLFSYSVGAGVPMLAIAYGGQHVSRRIPRIARYSYRLQQGFGVLITMLAVALYLQYDTLMTVWLSAWFPSFQVRL